MGAMQAQFKYIFKNVWILITISLKFVTRCPIDEKSIIGSDNGLAPKKRQAIMRTNDSLCCRRIYASLGSII